MKRKVSAFVVAIGLVVLVGSPAAHAQSAGKHVVAKVEFEFSVGDRVLPAGAYRVTRPDSGMGNLKIQSVDGEREVAISAISRLAWLENIENRGHSPEAALVFVMVGDHHFLSEIWIPGQDGYLVRRTSEEHQRLIVKIAK